ncbi:MAG: TrmH family RNA methyltransferase [bacterium]|nr:TrmH family RNA methyltransferase [bacterium]
MKLRKDRTSQEIIVLLHNIRSAHNVGSIFRTSDAVGVNRIVLSGYSPAPRDEYKRVRRDIAKVALGAEHSVPWEKVENLGKYLSVLREHGFRVVAVEQSRQAVDYSIVRSSKKMAFIFGNEVEGLPRDILAVADVVAEIPMKGKKESLNVSVAAGIALFRILGR